MTNVNKMPAIFMVANSGGDLSAVDDQGEIFWTVGLTPGIHEAKKYIKYLAPGQIFDWGEGVIGLAQDQSHVRSNAYGKGANETGANPDYRPTAATAAELRVRKMLNDVTEKSDAIERRQASIKKMLDDRETRQLARVKAGEQQAADELVEAERIAAELAATAEIARQQEVDANAEASE